MIGRKHIVKPEDQDLRPKGKGLDETACLRIFRIWSSFKEDMGGFYCEKRADEMCGYLNREAKRHGKDRTYHVITENAEVRHGAKDADLD